MQFSFECPNCKARGKIDHPCRRDNEEITGWMESLFNVFQTAHTRISPRCQNTKLTVETVAED